jgi:hypothetical protein
MAQVASCPQCGHEFFIPEGADANALATCPHCYASFELSAAECRELPAAMLTQPNTAPPNPKRSAPTLADFSTMSTLLGDSDDELQLDQTQQHPTAEAIAESKAAAGFAENAPAAQPTQQDSPEAAAERIDAWFRSAKTIIDGPPIEHELANEGQEDPIEPPHRVENRDTIGIDAGDTDVPGMDSEFELDPAAQPHHDLATWDDSQHMDRLLAGLHNEPIDTFEPTGQQEVQHPGAEELVESAGWSPDTSISIAPSPSQTRRKRSVLRTLVGTVVGGGVGLALGYYVLLWIKGPDFDVLQLAKYLPKAALPASFRAEPDEENSSTVDRPSNMAADLAASESSTDTSTPTAEASKKTDVAPQEKQAAYTVPAEPPKNKNDDDNRYPTSPVKNESAVREPAALDAPPAKSLKPNTASNESDSIHLASAPTYAVADLHSALTAAREARANLEAGEISDPKIGPVKGKAYMALADLAQKATFVAQASPSEMSKARTEIEQFFRETFANQHTRNEVSLIAPKWLAHPTRPHNGIFFAGTPTHQDSKGSVVECSVDLGGGQSITVLLPPSTARQVNSSSRPVVVLGWIINKPAEDVAGYTGTATQAVFAKGLFSLE